MKVRFDRDDIAAMIVEHCKSKALISADAPVVEIFWLIDATKFESNAAECVVVEVGMRSAPTTKGGG